MFKNCCCWMWRKNFNTKPNFHLSPFKNQNIRPCTNYQSYGEAYRLCVCLTLLYWFEVFPQTEKQLYRDGWGRRAALPICALLSLKRRVWATRQNSLLFIKLIYRTPCFAQSVQSTVSAMNIYFLTRGGEQTCRQLPQNPFVRDILLFILFV